MIAICSLKTVPQNVPNGNFESWEFNMAGMPEPEGWKTENDQEMILVESAKGHDGNFSACLNVVWDRMKQEYSGGTLTTESRFPVDEKYSELTGFYSGNSNNYDTLFITINLFADEKEIAAGTASMTTVNSGWQQFNIEINYKEDIKPDEAGISISIIPAKGFHHQTVYCLDELCLTTGQDP
jgi:hypothetical protein